MTKRMKIAVSTCVVLPILFYAAVFFIGFFNLFHSHEHCIKNSGLTLRLYARDHAGRFPYDTNGFGNALLLLIKDDTYSGIAGVRFITGPGDDGKVFLEALKTGARIPEEQCSRVYVQGLSETNEPEIAILFDKKPTPGGDHSRRPWGPLLREVCLVDGSMKIIGQADWPSFATNQIELLVKEGFERTTAEHYYRIP